MGIIGLDRGFVGSTQVDLVSRFDAAGLRVHEVETHKHSAELHGSHLDLERFRTRITNSRCWKVRLVLLRQQSCIDECLEVIITCCSGDLPLRP